MSVVYTHRITEGFKKKGFIHGFFEFDSEYQRFNILLMNNFEPVDSQYKKWVDPYGNVAIKNDPYSVSGRKMYMLEVNMEKNSEDNI